MSIYICADPGSCHMGKRQYGFELIDAARNAGCSAIKFQLFSGKEYEEAGNIPLSFELFREFYYYGKDKKIAVTASVFNQKAFEEIFKYDVPFVKFSYSQQHQHEWIKACLNTGRKPVVSSDVMQQDKLPKGVTKLYCIPEYPVRYQINFEGLFPERFQGFSDHSLGYKQALEAANNGAVWIEKHIRLFYSDITCPDAKFALDPNELEAMVRDINP